MRSIASMLALLFVAGCACVSTGCKDDAKNGGPKGSPPPPPPGVAASGSGSAAAGSVCNDAAIGFSDPRTATVLPTKIAGFCALKANPVQVWGDGTSKDIKDIADAIDGAGDIYVRNYFARRFEIAKYSDERGTLAEVEVWVSTFGKPESAYGLFSYRVVANVDPDPAAAAKAKRRPMKPIPGGGAAALGNAQAFMWKGNVLIEATYNADPSKSAEQATAEADVALPAVIKAIGDKIAGGSDLPLDVRLLPTEAEGRLPLGIDYVPPKFVRPEGKADALHLDAGGGYAVAYLKEGIKRSRVLAFSRDEVDAARDVMSAFRKLAGAVTLKEKDFGDEAVFFPFVVGPGGPGAEGKAEGIAVRKGRIVLAMIDEELALGDPAIKDLYPRTSKDEKITKLKALLAVRNGPPEPGTGAAPAPSGSAP